MSTIFAAELGRWFKGTGWDMQESLHSWWLEGHMGEFADKSITIHDPASRRRKKLMCLKVLLLLESSSMKL